MGALRHRVLWRAGRVGGGGQPLRGGGPGHHTPHRGPSRAGAFLRYVDISGRAGICGWMCMQVCLVCLHPHASFKTLRTPRHDAASPNQNSGSSARGGSTCSRSGSSTASTRVRSCPSTSTAPASPCRCVALRALRVCARLWMYACLGERKASLCVYVCPTCVYGRSRGPISPQPVFSARRHTIFCILGTAAPVALCGRRGRGLHPCLPRAAGHH